MIGVENLFNNVSANWTAGVHPVRSLRHGEFNLRDHAGPHWDR